MAKKEKLPEQAEQELKVEGNTELFRDSNFVYVKRKAHPDQKNKFTTKEWGLLSKDKDGGKDGWVIDAPTPSELQK